MQELLVGSARCGRSRDLDAMRGLIKDERKKIALAEDRALAKALEDLAGAKFVRALRKAA